MPDDNFAAVRERVDPVALVEGLTQARVKHRSPGDVRLAPCPFCDSKTGFSVNPQTKTYCCHHAGCGAQGDVFTFVQKVRGFAGPREALESLAERVGHTLEHPGCHRFSTDLRRGLLVPRDRKGEADASGQLLCGCLVGSLAGAACFPPLGIPAVLMAAARSPVPNQHFVLAPKPASRAGAGTVSATARQTPAARAMDNLSLLDGPSQRRFDTFLSCLGREGSAKVRLDLLEGGLEMFEGTPHGKTLEVMIPKP